MWKSGSAKKRAFLNDTDAGNLLFVVATPGGFECWLLSMVQMIHFSLCCQVSSGSHNDQISQPACMVYCC